VVQNSRLKPLLQNKSQNEYAPSAELLFESVC
jgi:hypothetical protein